MMVINVDKLIDSAACTGDMIAIAFGFVIVLCIASFITICCGIAIEDWWKKHFNKGKTNDRKC